MRNGTTTKVGRKVTTALLALAMALGGVLASAPVALAYDDPFVKTADNTSLGTSGIVMPADKWNKDSGSYVWYGSASASDSPGASSEANPLRFRVLANGTNAFTGGDKTMLLDCDTIPFTGVQWDSRNESNEWVGSGVQSKANEFERRLTEQEWAAVRTSSTNEGAEPTDPATMQDFKIRGDKVFVLSVGEANGTYYDADDDASRVKKDSSGQGGYWWLRSAGGSRYYAAFVDDDGYVYSDGFPVDVDFIGVSPAFNVNLSSVIFSSEISEATQESGAQYKLTLKTPVLAQRAVPPLTARKQP